MKTLVLRFLKQDFHIAQIYPKQHEEKRLSRTKDTNQDTNQ